MWHPSHFRWYLAGSAIDVAASLRQRHGEAWYKAQRAALQSFLCQYIDSTCNRCDVKSNTVSPVGGGPPGAHCLKVRWAMPGYGKSGGLRLAVAIYLGTEQIVISFAEVRSNDPPLGDLLKSAHDHRPPKV